MGEGEDLFFIGEVVRRVEAVVDAVPRFDADIFCAGLRPDAQAGCAAEVYVHAAGVFTRECCAAGAQAGEDQCVVREGIRQDLDFAAFAEYGNCFFGAKRVCVQPERVRGLGFVQNQAVAHFALEAGMRADGEVHGLI